MSGSKSKTTLYTTKQQKSWTSGHPINKRDIATLRCHANSNKTKLSTTPLPQSTTKTSSLPTRLSNADSFLLWPVEAGSDVGDEAWPPEEDAEDREVPPQSPPRQPPLPDRIPAPPELPAIPLQDNGLPAIPPNELPEHQPVQEDSYITNIAAWLARQHEIFADLVLQPSLQQQQPSRSRSSFLTATQQQQPRSIIPTPHPNARPMIKHWTNTGIHLQPTTPIKPTIQQESYIPKNTKLFNSVEEEILKLHQNGFISRINRHKVKVSMPIFAVPKSSQDKTKIRLVYDARYTNKFLKPPPFNLPTIPKSLKTCPKGYGFVSDISSGYHHIPLHPSAKPFLCFRWRGAYFQWEVLPFGLSTAPWIFQTWLSSYLQHWQKQHKNTFLRQYIDDILVAHKSQTHTNILRKSLLTYLNDHGIKAHKDKTTPVLSTLQYLGYNIDLQDGTVGLSPGRLSQIKRIIGFLNSTRKVPRKFMEKWLGLVNWCRAGSREVLARMKPFFKQLHNTRTYFMHIIPHQFDFLYPLLSRRLTFRYQSHPIDIFTDATLQQGAYIVHLPTLPHTSDEFAKVANFKVPQQYQTSSFASEFFTAMTAINNNLHIKHIRLWCDNLGVCYVLKKGTTNHALVSTILPRFWKQLESREIKLSIFYIPSEINPADYWSRSTLLSHRYGKSAKPHYVRITSFD